MQRVEYSETGDINDKTHRNKRFYTGGATEVDEEDRKLASMSKRHDLTS